MDKIGLPKQRLTTNFAEQLISKLFNQTSSTTRHPSTINPQKKSRDLNMRDRAGS